MSESNNKIIFDKNVLEKSLRDLAQEKNFEGRLLSLSEIDALIACFVPADALCTEKPVESAREKDSVITKIISKIISFIPKGKNINDDLIKFIFPDGVSIHENAYDIVLKNRKWDNEKILTQGEVDELIKQLIEVSSDLQRR